MCENVNGCVAVSKGGWLVAYAIYVKRHSDVVDIVLKHIIVYQYDGSRISLHIGLLLFAVCVQTKYFDFYPTYTSFLCSSNLIYFFIF